MNYKLPYRLAMRLLVSLLLFLTSYGAMAQSDTVVSKLEPAVVFKYLRILSTIPRCSGNEGPVAQYVAGIAKTYGDTVVIDSSNNVLVHVPASAGFQSQPLVCLQAHLDMVCQTTDKTPASMFPLSLYLDGNLLKARNSTLGADDGIGVATSLAIMTNPTIKHGPLELLFTTGEESGFVGASHFDFRQLKSKIFINLDSEDEGVLTVGSAGGSRMEVRIPVQWTHFDPSEAYLVTIQGLRGGHSGGDINKGRINAIKLTRLKGRSS
jgi:dipeptidase D